MQLQKDANNSRDAKNSKDASNSRDANNVKELPARPVMPNSSDAS
jgi:hypothetical protein